MYTLCMCLFIHSYIICYTSLLSEYYPLHNIHIVVPHRPKLHAMTCYSVWGININYKLPGGGPGTGGIPAGGRLYVCGPAAAEKQAQNKLLQQVHVSLHNKVIFNIYKCTTITMVIPLALHSGYNVLIVLLGSQLTSISIQSTLGSFYSISTCIIMQTKKVSIYG